MEKWEYKTLSFKTSGFLGGKIGGEKMEDELNAYGQDGWELVSCFDTSFGQGTSRDVIAIMKKRRP